LKRLSRWPVSWQLWLATLLPHNQSITREQKTKKSNNGKINKVANLLCLDFLLERKSSLKSLEDKRERYWALFSFPLALWTCELHEEGPMSRSSDASACTTSGPNEIEAAPLLLSLGLLSMEFLYLLRCIVQRGWWAVRLCEDSCQL
jgi:hypothetical protein